MTELAKQLRRETGGLSMIEIDALMSEAAARIEALEARCNDRMVEIQRAREIIERLSASKEKFFLALVDVKHRCVSAIDLQPFERLRAINSIADVVLEALADAPVEIQVRGLDEGGCK
jgi:hypothetical protein